MYIDHKSHTALILSMMKGEKFVDIPLTHIVKTEQGVCPFVFLPIQEANTSFMNVCNLSHPIWPKIHDQQSLMLRWRSISRWGRKGIAIYLAYKGGQ